MKLIRGYFNDYRVSDSTVLNESGRGNAFAVRNNEYDSIKIC